MAWSKFLASIWDYSLYLVLCDLVLEIRRLRVASPVIVMVSHIIIYQKSESFT
jgi:hypothetical protein